ncbi:MAG: hypothetical protein KDC98_19145 [Planctomycetes bacterium]|nr:hypothetical protein [Planctomycetota bacterium]
MVWTLEAEFVGLLAAPGPRQVDWAALRQAANDLPVGFAAVRVGSALSPHATTSGLASGKGGEQQAAMLAVRQAVEVARTIGCPRVIVEPGLVPVFGEIEEDDLGETAYRWNRERVDALLARRSVHRNQALDHACRAIHALVRGHPDVTFCMTSGRNIRTVADHQGLRDLFEDLHQLPLGYWHDAAVGARREQELAEPQGAMLESFGNRLQGMSLGDASADGMYREPGSGGVDYGLLATYVPRVAPFAAVLELDPSVGKGELAGMRSCLRKYGL